MKCLLLIFLLASCGDELGETGDEPEQGVDSQAFIDIKPIIKSNCGVAGCHDGAQKPFSSEKRFRSSQAKTRLQNGSMPLNRTISEADKKSLIDFLSSI